MVPARGANPLLVTEPESARALRAACPCYEAVMSLVLRASASSPSLARLVAVGALVGCGGGAGDASHSASPAASQAAAPPSAAPGESASASAQPSEPRSTLLGSWVSASCGERKYERQLSFEAGNRFASLELVSPCPPGARCVWSGIVQRLGSYEQKGTRVGLVVDAPVDSHGQPLPEAVEFDGRVVERAPDGSACEYVYRP
jgi:hypothetical protein